MMLLGNIGIGEQALKNNSSGENNIAVGNTSLLQGTNFDNNLAIGSGALQNNGSSNNTAIGYQALNFNTNSGGNNTAIGFGADIGSSTITNSTAIGANATVTTSNTIQLGDTSLTNVNTSGIVSSTGFETTGTVTATNVTIGTQLTLTSNSSTVAPLELNATALNDGVGALNIDSVEPDINLNDTDGGWSTITFENNSTPTVAIGRDTNDDFYITTGGPPWPIRFTIEDTTGDARFYQDLRVDGDITYVGTISDISDRRVKENFEDINNAISIIDQIKPLKYKKFSNIQKLGNSWEEYGFIAQEIKKVLPILVKKGNTSESLLSINYTGFIPILTKAIQDQQRIIDQNQSEINQLKYELNSLKSLVEKHLNQSTKE